MTNKPDAPQPPRLQLLPDSTREVAIRSCITYLTYWESALTDADLFRAIGTVYDAGAARVAELEAALKQVKFQLKIAHNVLLTEYGQHCGISDSKCAVCLEVEALLAEGTPE